MLRARIRVDGRMWRGVCKRFWGRQWRSAMGAGGQERTEDTARGARGPGWCELAGTFSWPDGGSVADGRRQAGSGMARNRARARLTFSCHGQLLGRWRVSRRAERVSRPAREKNRRLRVLVVTIRSPRLMRAVQRARLWAIACTASQAALAAKRPEGRWFSPTPYLRSRIAFSIFDRRRYLTIPVLGLLQLARQPQTNETFGE